MTDILIPSLEYITDAAKQFVAQMGSNRIYAFYGGMGAGKTTFIKAICEELGVTDVVTSPTFAIVNEYSSKIGPIYHFDFYRIKRSSEVLDIGFEEYAFRGNLCLMEWPELIEDFLPEETICLEIKETEGGMRKITLKQR